MESENPPGASAPLNEHSPPTLSRQRLLRRLLMALAAVSIVAVVIYQSVSFTGKDVCEPP